MIDTGVQDLSDFSGCVVRVRVLGSGGSTLLPDTYGHGSFVSGVLGGKSADGKFVGVAPGATLYAINVEGGDGTAYSSDVIAGLGWVYAHAAENNIRVVNLSVSETTPSNYDTNRLDTVIEQLWRTGIVVVASAGNLGPNTSFFAPRQRSVRDHGEVGGTGASWNGASWNAASWNAAASWNTAASWNAEAAWFTAASWNAASWNAASWNGASWNGASWNAASWNAASWNAASWNAASWNALSWNALSWNAASWN